MNQKQEKRRRLNARIDHIEAFALWLAQEPPMWRVVRWHLWKRRRPSRPRRPRNTTAPTCKKQRWEKELRRDG